MKKMLSRFLFILFLLFPALLFSQKNVTVRGYIYENTSKEAMQGATIYCVEYDAIAHSNQYGFYALTLPPTDSVTLLFHFPGIDIDTIKIPFLQDTTLSWILSMDKILSSVTVSAKKQASEEAQMSTISISTAEVKQLPALLGEKDVFKTLMLMPGVQSASEGNSGIIVRGGSPDQNLIILDEATIYNANHLLGFFSIFNGDAVRSVELIKGGFPARYGGRLSSIINVTMKEGNKNEYHGEGGIGILSSHVVVEGPIVKDKSSFMISGRRTYFDLLSMPIMMILIPEISTGYFFHDFNAKFNYDFGEKDKLFVSGFWGMDKFHMKAKDNFMGEKTVSKAGASWQNGTASLRWNHIFGKNIFSNLSFVFNDYTMSIFAEEKNSRDFLKMNLNSGIRDYMLKYDITLNLNAVHTFYMGAAFTLHKASPSIFTLKASTELDRKEKTVLFGGESALYFEDQINIKNRFKINPGIRLVMFNTTGKSYFMAEPRLNMSYNIKKNFAVKASYALMHQYMLLLGNTSIGMPTDLWIPVTKNIRPQRSQQVALGFVYDLPKQGLEFTLEGYYKKMDRIVGMKEGTNLLLFDIMDEFWGLEDSKSDWENSITSGQGWAYGAEFMVRKKAGKFTGWVAYTLSWVQHQFDELNFGKKYFARYDRRHDVAIVLMYSPTKKINLSLSWVFATGNAVTLPDHFQSYGNVGQFLNGYYNQNYATNTNMFTQMESYGEKNNLRMEPFHHLDIGVQFIKPHKKKKFESIFEVSIYNVYNNKNAFYYYVENNYDVYVDEYGVVGDKTTATLKKVSIFPIIPSFTYHFKF